ncbi:MAG: hypothetical protein AAF236_03120 [Verrucomicrobiota bacterium]
MFDELSISFENPATDPLGHNHVAGKLYCGRDQVELQYKMRDRAFKKNEPITISFDYGEVEGVELVSRWFKPKLLIFQTRSPDKLADFPGADVGRVELQVIRESVGDAKRVAALIDLKQSEAFVAESEDRLSARRRAGEP